MGTSENRVVRVLSNNAVLAQDGDRTVVLVGRGVGFGRRDGSVIDPDTVESTFVQLDPAVMRALEWMRGPAGSALEVISRAIDETAAEVGGLRPAAHALLLDHIALAVQRVGAGETIDNPLAETIAQLYPAELAAARSIVARLNEQLGLGVPEAEAGFIALHLNAARRGEAVRRPLHLAHSLAAAVRAVLAELEGAPAAVRSDVTRELAGLAARIRGGAERTTPLAQMVRDLLPGELLTAQRALAHLRESAQPPASGEGEAALLALRIHGWRCDCAAAHERNDIP